MSVSLNPVGQIVKENGCTMIVVGKEYIKGLKGLGAFGHVMIIWWMDGCDNPHDRAVLVQQKPYVKGPEELGVFATRSPERPNPIAISCAGITFVDEKGGVIGIDFCDANDGTPVLDIKPYTPSIDRIEKPDTANWCKHWPKSYEASGSFDWAKEFNFKI